jgi:hypothetical protein
MVVIDEHASPVKTAFLSLSITSAATWGGAAAAFRAMELITIRNRSQRFRSFVYSHARLSASHHAASLISARCRNPFPPMGASAIRDAIQLCLHGFHFNSPVFRLTLISPVTLFRQLYREFPGCLRAIISPKTQSQPLSS